MFFLLVAPFSDALKQSKFYVKASKFISEHIFKSMRTQIWMGLMMQRMMMMTMMEFQMMVSLLLCKVCLWFDLEADADDDGDGTPDQFEDQDGDGLTNAGILSMALNHV